MLRAFGYFIVVVLISVLFIFLQQYDCSLIILYNKGKITISAALAVVILLASLFILFFVAYLLKFIFTSPWVLTKHLKSKNKLKNASVFKEAIMAYISNDELKVKELSNKLRGVGPKKVSDDISDLYNVVHPLLNARVDEIVGDKNSAVKRYATMAASENTNEKLIGLHALYQIALRCRDYEACAGYAREAFKYSAGFEWANDILLSYSVSHKDWHGAKDLLQTIERNVGKAASIKSKLQEKRAIIFAAQAQAIFKESPHTALQLAVKAYDITQENVGINLIYSMILFNSGDRKKAEKFIEHLWRAKPHPDYAKIYIYNEYQSLKTQIEKAEKLYSLREDSVYSAFALSEAYFNNGSYIQAAEYCHKALDIEPLRRCYELLQTINKANGAKEQTRYETQMFEAYDYAWVGDGVILNHWQPLSPQERKLGGVEWQRVDSNMVDMKPKQVLTAGSVDTLRINVDDPGVAE